MPPRVPGDALHLSGPLASGYGEHAMAGYSAGTNWHGFCGHRMRSNERLSMLHR